MAFIGQTPGPLTTGTNIADGTITAADLHTTLDLSGKTITYPSNSVTAAALHTTAVTDKLGYTPLQSSDLTGYATESYVTTAVSNLVDSAPGALDTLNELAAALNDDANFSTTITNSLALKAPLASPSFTGNVGIGTSSPATKLDVSGTGSQEIRITSNTSGNSRLGFNVAGSVYAYWEADRTSGAMIYSNGTERMRIDSSGNLLFNSGYGSVATAYGCRAWVNFNGTGTVAIRASGNVSSITDYGTGDYGINFTTAMPDANYSFSGCCQYLNTGGVSVENIDFRMKNGSGLVSTTSLRVYTSVYTPSGYDCAIVTAVVFR